MKRIALASALAATLCLATAACGSGGNPLDTGSSGSSGAITIGSANFVENVLLGNVYAEALQGNGVKVNTKFNIGSREIIFKQTEDGSLDVLPEYNGALLSYLDPKSNEHSTAEVDNALRSRLPKSLTVLNPAAAEDKDVLALTAATARKYNLRSIADLQGHSTSMVFGGAPEDQTRYQGYAGVQKAYGLRFKEFKALDQAGPITIKALEKGDVQVAILYTTTPQIASEGFVRLADPKGVFGVQNVVPLIYQPAVSPKARAILNRVSARLDSDTLTKLNARVELDHEDPDTVAKDWLKSVGLVSS